MRLRHVLVLAFVTAAAAGAHAQSHAPASKPAEPAAPATAENKDLAPGGSTHDEAHGAQSGEGHDAAPKDKPRPKPTVSSVALRPAAKAPAAVAHEADGHGKTSGYVATGSSKRATKKAKPVVSAGALAAPVTGGEAAHDSHAAPVPHAPDSHAPDAPPQSAPPAAPAHGAEAHEAPPAGAPAPESRKPMRLSDVHERITAALAEVRGDARTSDHAAEPHAAGAHAASTGRSSPGESGRADGPRVSVRWPAPRWVVSWPDASRVTLTWPEPAPPPARRRADPH